MSKFHHKPLTVEVVEDDPDTSFVVIRLPNGVKFTLSRDIFFEVYQPVRN